MTEEKKHLCWNKYTLEVCGHPCEDYLSGYGCCCNGHQAAPYEEEEVELVDPTGEYDDGWWDFGWVTYNGAWQFVDEEG